LLEQAEVILERAWIGVEVLPRAELERVHEDAGDHPAVPLPRRSHQAKVTLVQRPHRRDQGDAVASGPPRPGQGAEAGHGLNHLHLVEPPYTARSASGGAAVWRVPAEAYECSASGKVPASTSAMNSPTARTISPRRSAKRFTNLGTFSPERPSMSWITSTWPSVPGPAPMPMVGMSRLLLTAVP